MPLKYIATALGAALKVFTIWFFVTSLFFKKKLKPFDHHAPKTRFACLIAARNEQAVIKDTVKSLLAQDYPKELFDVYVIPNNCTDLTGQEAKKAGAEIIECALPVKKKADALRQAAETLRGEGHDVFCVFDADNFVDPGFLSAMNDAFCSGARIAKARMLAKNPAESWVSGCYAIYYGLFDAIFNRSRAAVGLSAKLVGTGFAIQKEFLYEIDGFNCETIAEDAELAALCAASGQKVFWVSKAVTYDEAPADLKTSVKQRMRWSSGIMDVADKKVPRLLRAVRGKNVFRALDSLFTVCAPFAQALSPLPLILSASYFFISGTVPRGIILLPLSLALSWAASAALAALTAAFIGGKGKWAVKSALMFPVFTVSWLPIHVISLLHRTRSWSEIRHKNGAAPESGQYRACGAANNL